MWTLREVGGTSIRFSVPTMTPITCARGMESERAFVEALQAVRAWRIDGRMLELLTDKGEVVARFESPAPR
jgi:heat shock protein HslJ